MNTTTYTWFHLKKSKKRWLGHRDDTGRGPCEDTGGDGRPQAGTGTDASLTALRRNQPRRHPALGPLAAKTVRESTSVALSSLSGNKHSPGKARLPSSKGGGSLRGSLREEMSPSENLGCEGLGAMWLRPRAPGPTQTTAVRRYHLSPHACKAGPFSRQHDPVWEKKLLSPAHPNWVLVIWVN